MANPSLLFGDKKVDTSLAEEYLKSNKEYQPIGSTCKITGKGFDSCGNAILYSDDCEIRQNQEAVRQEYFIRLSEEIKKNADLISQLDYMIRKNPIEETKIYMGLIEQQVIYWSQFKSVCQVGPGTYTKLNLTDDSCLLALGWLPKILHSVGVIIKATKEVAVVVYLFTKMCHEVGFKNIVGIFIEDAKSLAMTALSIKPMPGCVGVITERSDMESALDVFLGSTTSAPWKLERIWVQECIYEEFKLTLLRKCNIRKGGTSEAVLSSNEFTIEGKQIIIDSTENPSNTMSRNIHAIRVEAYRTAKELISLLNDEHQFLSLWASDISEAHEIAFSVSTPVVWINDYGTFYGPPKTSQSVFTKNCLHQDPVEEGSVLLPKTRVSILNEKLNFWKRITPENRKHVIRDVLIKLLVSNEDKTNVDEIYKMINNINRTHGKFIDIDKGNICISIDSIPTGTIFFENLPNDIGECLQIILQGNSSVINLKNLKPYFVNIFETLFEAGVPVICEIIDKGDESTLASVKVLRYPTDVPNTRVIRSNFGTIFAN